MGVAEGLPVGGRPRVGHGPGVLGADRPLLQRGGEGHDLADAAGLKDRLDAAGGAVRLGRGLEVGRVDRVGVGQHEHLAGGGLHDHRAPPVGALRLDDLVDGVLRDGLQVRVDGGAHRRSRYRLDLLLLAGGDDRPGLADLDAALAVGAREPLVLGQLEARGADEDAAVPLVGVPEHVARHVPRRIGAAGALVGLDAGNGQGLDLPPGVRGDGLGDDGVGLLPHHLGAELLGVDAEDVCHLPGGGRGAVADNDLRLLAGGRVDAVLDLLVLGDLELVDADVVRDGRGCQDRAVASQDVAPGGAVDPGDGALALGPGGELRARDHLEPGGASGQGGEPGQAHDLKGLTAAGVHGVPTWSPPWRRCRRTGSSWTGRRRRAQRPGPCPARPPATRARRARRPPGRPSGPSRCGRSGR